MAMPLCAAAVAESAAAAVPPMRPAANLSRPSSGRGDVTAVRSFVQGSRMSLRQIPAASQKLRAFRSATVRASATATSGSPAGATGGEVDTNHLLDWMRTNGLPDTCKVVLKEKPGAVEGEESIHYTAASEDLQPGDLALHVPNSLIVTLQRVLGDETLAELLTTNKLSELACLALYLMYEKKRGKASFWHPYIQELDRQRGRGQSAVETPLLWAPEEVEEYFEGSPMKDVVKERLHGIEREYAELDTVWFLAGSLFKEYPFDIPSEAFPFEIFKQAFIAVQACIVHLQGVSIARRFALVPLGPPLLAYRSTSRAMLAMAPSGDGVELKVDRPIKAGDPISVWCGPQPNTRLLLNYGFVDEDNPYDRLPVKAALDANDPLYQAKRAIVQRNDKLTIQTFQLYRGKEKDVVQDMLPYLRLGHVTDAQDLDSVSFAEGPVCGVSPCNERAVLDQLVAYFTGRLAGYPTTIEEDDTVIADPSTNPKRLVAARLVRIEKKILTNALDAVKDIIRLLPPGSIADPCISRHPPILT